MKSCFARYDAWLWNTPGFTQQEKAVNHIKSHAKTNETCLFIFRVIAALVWLGHAIENWIKWQTTESELHLPLLYFTNWSLYLTIIYFVLVSVAYLRRSKTDDGQPVDIKSCCSLWKWSSLLFLLTFVCNMLTTLLFWLLLYPMLDLNRLNYSWIALHGGPLAFTLIDFALNRIVIERNQWVIILKVSFIYSAMLIIYTKGRSGHDAHIYPMYKLKTIGSWVTLLMTQVFAILLHFTVYGFSKCKYGRCCCCKCSTRKNEEEIKRETT